VEKRNNWLRIKYSAPANAVIRKFNMMRHATPSM
jgi:hypothetical protein